MISEAFEERHKLIHERVLPGCTFGPYAQIYPRPITKENLGTNVLNYRIMKGPTSPAAPFVVDVRDVAKSRVLRVALDRPRNLGALEKCYLVNGGNLTWREAIGHLKITHPELNTPPLSGYPDLPGPASILDTSDTITDLKFGTGNFIDVKQTIDQGGSGTGKSDLGSNFFPEASKVGLTNLCNQEHV